ncbi:hypothetical protein [Flavobacterium tructae]|uniref:Uncharacterized protein n=1 Tax=Flavobacterium tructae TaxID=1114873 RepID=A0A1S1J2I4_9FLAO|nr:hypothetical protein [Flavobacterium tructae]OHT43669.1 hypothetical protein BHE19_18010 [Flavobacterium tructae]OXB15900.1 hypothetical protein B0A71_20035 [Flavobacterium tructae]
MKLLLDLDTFVQTLNDKGYDGYFHTEGCCPGKLRDSISRFLELWKNGSDAPLSAGYLNLSTYLQWNGQEKPKVQCNISVRYENGKFDLEHTEMYIKRTDPYGQLLKESKLANLTSNSIPTLKEAVAQVSENPKEEAAPKKRGLRI